MVGVMIGAKSKHTRYDVGGGGRHKAVLPQARLTLLQMATSRVFFVSSHEYYY